MVSLDHQGLTQQQASDRLLLEGFNDLPVSGRRTHWRIIKDIVSEPMFALLLAAGCIYVLLGDLQESVLMAVFASLSVVITAIQEIRSERVLEALRDLTSPRALVVRDGEALRIPGREVVRGDILILKEGDRVPADALILSGDGILTDESLLTGESVAVNKKVSDGLNVSSSRPGGDGQSFVYAGSLIVHGGGRAIVVATGHRSEIGKIGLALSSIEAEQPRLRMQTRKIVRFFAFGALVFTAGLVTLNGFLYGDWLKAFMGGIALSMSLLPEEFPLVLAVFTVMGAWRISKVRVLTRRAAAIETLGSATVLCTDKTGTLTKNKMTIRCVAHGKEFWELDSGTPASTEIAETLSIGTLASRKESYDPMDMAFYDFQGTQAIDLFSRSVLRHYSLDTRLLAMGNAYQQEEGYLIAVKGAPEAIARLCGLSKDEVLAQIKTVDCMAQSAMRVLGVAKAIIRSGDIPETLDKISYAYSGLVGFADPLREGVPEAVKEALGAGIRVVMITGDYPATAHAIAAQAGILSDRVMTGAEIEKLSDIALQEGVRQASIFCRIMPEQKLRIVQALKANGEVVAMTGDGVNDAPSLKAAHIGIAMGGRGTDVAREASSIVLLDDDFNSLVRTIRLGRRIYDNIRKAFLYIIAVHVPIAGIAFLPALFGWPLILTPLLIALLELVVDPACSIVLEAEEEENDIMSRPPRDPKSSIISPEILGLGIAQGILGLVMTAGVLIMAQVKSLPVDETRSLVFASLVTINLALIFATRSFSSSLVTALRRPNPFLWRGVVAISLFFSLLMLWSPAREVFHFGPLHLHDVLIAVGAGLLLLILLEYIKVIWQRNFSSVFKGR